ncbi:hypothetical protein L218DRAFT_507041 [Marasmius fiardii PR-910]|nr:hypothetical protein L218DRAFT_507041 [Marasmius fiardii PR-910]
MSYKEKLPAMPSIRNVIIQTIRLDRLGAIKGNKYTLIIKFNGKKLNKSKWCSINSAWNVNLLVPPAEDLSIEIVRRRGFKFPFSCLQDRPVGYGDLPSFLDLQNAVRTGARRVVWYHILTHKLVR